MPSEDESGLFQIKASREYGDVLPCEIQDVYAFASFNSGWIDPELFYESPHLVFEVESPLGKLYTEIEFRDITDGHLKELFNFSSENVWEFDVRDLTGETVFFAPDEQFNQGTLYVEDGPHTTFDSSNAFIFRDEGSCIVDRDIGWDENKLGSERREIEWLNNHLRMEYERESSSFNGWIEREIDRVEVNDETISVWVGINGDWEERWTFDNSVSGKVRLVEWAEAIGLPTEIGELEGSVVYIHPVRNLHHEFHGKYPIDALERWVLSGSPKTPPENSSVFDKVRRFFSSPSINVEVETTTPARAKSSVSCSSEIVDYCRQKHTNDEKELEVA